MSQEEITFIETARPRSWEGRKDLTSVVLSRNITSIGERERFMDVLDLHR